MNEIQNIEATLNRIVELKEEYFENGNMFNFLATINKTNDEVSHSAILAELLNPSGSHGQRTKILREFLTIAEINIESDLESATIRTEHYCEEENGRIDVLIAFKKHECIIIENKVFASDQPKQLARYHSWAIRNQYSKIHLVYLTPEGEEPSGQSRQELALNQIKILSYRKHIKTLLNNCQTNIKGQNRIHFILCDYEATINKFLGIMNEALKEEIVSLLKTNRYNEIIPELEQAIIDFKSEIQFDFWSKIIEQINQSGISKYKVDPPSRFEILSYYQRDSKPRIIKEWPLVGLENLGLKLKLQIMTNFAYGISPINSTLLPKENLVEMLSKSKFQEDSTRQNWLIWKYPSSEIEKLNFKNLNRQAIDSVQTDNIETIANEIITDIKSLQIKSN